MIHRFSKFLLKIITDNLKNAVNLIKTTLHVAGSPGGRCGSWLGSIPMISSLMNNPIIKFCHLITASWNTWVGKAFFAGFIGREIVPFIKRNKKGRFFGQLLSPRQPVDQNLYGRHQSLCSKRQGCVYYHALLCRRRHDAGERQSAETITSTNIWWFFP